MQVATRQWEGSLARITWRSEAWSGGKLCLPWKARRTSRRRDQVNATAVVMAAGSMPGHGGMGFWKVSSSMTDEKSWSSTGTIRDTPMDRKAERDAR